MEAELLSVLLSKARIAASVFTASFRYPYDDAYSDALYGGLKAALRYDPTLGDPGPYLYRRAYGEILDNYRRECPVPRTWYQREIDFDLLPTNVQPALRLDLLPEDDYREANWVGYDDPDLTSWETAEFVARFLIPLNDRERYCVIQRYLVGRTLISIAGDLDVTESRVCQIIRVALTKAREMITPELRGAVAA